MNPVADAGKLIIISAPSGSGKTSIVRHILNEEPMLEFSISATSRDRRGDEENGRDYYFINSQEFKDRIRKNEFVEWEEVYKNTYYGTLRSELIRIWNKGKHVIFDVDVIGGINLKKEFGNRALSIFIKPPGIDELRQRLIKRGTDPETKIEERLRKAAIEMPEAEKFDQTIINDDLDRACSEALELIRSFLNTD